MADDEEDKHATAPLRVAGFIDRDGDPVAVVIIGGVTFARLEGSLEEAMNTAKSALEVLAKLIGRKPDGSATNIEPRDPAKEN